MVTPHLPCMKFSGKVWSRSSRFLVTLLTKKQRNKQTNKEIEQKQYPAPGTYRGRGNKENRSITIIVSMHACMYVC